MIIYRETEKTTVLKQEIYYIDNSACMRVKISHRRHFANNLEQTCKCKELEPPATKTPRPLWVKLCFLWL